MSGKRRPEPLYILKISPRLLHVDRRFDTDRRVSVVRVFLVIMRCMFANFQYRRLVPFQIYPRSASLAKLECGCLLPLGLHVLDVSRSRKVLGLHLLPEFLLDLSQVSEFGNGPFRTCVFLVGFDTLVQSA